MGGTRREVQRPPEGGTGRIRPPEAAVYVSPLPRQRPFLRTDQGRHGNEQSKTFVRGTVEALYKDIERDQISGVEQTIIDYESCPVSFKKSV